MGDPGISRVSVALRTTAAAGQPQPQRPAATASVAECQGVTAQGGCGQFHSSHSYILAATALQPRGGGHRDLEATVCRNGLPRHKVRSTRSQEDRQACHILRVAVAARVRGPASSANVTNMLVFFSRGWACCLLESSLISLLTVAVWIFFILNGLELNAAAFGSCWVLSRRGVSFLTCHGSPTPSVLRTETQHISTS